MAKADEELEEFSRRGVVSPGALKAARWVSRGLWLAMTALVIILLWRQGDSVPQARLDRAVDDLKAKSKLADQYSEQLNELTGIILLEASEQGTLSPQSQRTSDVLRATLQAGRKARDELREVHPRLARMAEQQAEHLHDPTLAPEQLWRMYKEAPEAEKLVALARAVRGSSEAQRDQVASVAVSSRPVPERLLAVRFKGALGDAIWRKVLEGLAAGKGLVAEEAAAALK